MRTEAVMQALALNKKQSMIPMPSKRKSGLYGQKQKPSQAERVTGSSQVILPYSSPNLAESMPNCIDD